MIDKVIRQENSADAQTRVGEHPAWHRLEDQLQWYDARSTHCRQWYKRLEFGQLVLAVLIPLLSHLDPAYAK